MNVGGTWGLKREQGNKSLKNTDIYKSDPELIKKKKKDFSSHSDLSCLFSWAARSNSWIFLVICSVLRMTSSVLGSVGSESISKSSSSGIELPSPSQPLLLSLPLLQNLLSGWKNNNKSSPLQKPVFCYWTVHEHHFASLTSGWFSYPESSNSESLNVLS